jgi:HPt (histidine-containing phosphotransfer) domain-containing protein
VKGIAADIRMQSGIEELRAGFLDRIADRCMAIECIIAGAEGIVPTEEERDEISRHAHKTVGVAATFGYAALGARAMEVERLMSPGGRVRTWAMARPIIEGLLDEMERVLDEDAA